ncbi:nuclear transport factor 2 family protein [Mucilaginibacter sp. RB4R14]|uniref:nuclear transport factor 2 family protein n=1 Tax=Mucilaginibacter aurantiaciroseus TaxID=2949308 RepID=UPI0020911ACF|nr:nuclear transport factor 2 family protein [Mucilaginibacter aurantiaciroseus]MCO5933966.1 nuclear transport factor 2 family protein [Mucilaginibacter aurantiaciroseus]
MKTFQSVTLALALLITCSFAKAKDVPSENLTKTHAINTYVDAMTRGRVSNLSQVIDQSAKFDIQRGNTVLSYNKKEMTDFLKAGKNVEQACTTSTRIVENNTDMAVVKVDMKYDHFTRSNYVTLANTGTGWKITNVYSVFT